MDPEIGTAAPEFRRLSLGELPPSQRARFVRGARVLAGWDQQTLAAKAGIVRRTLVKIEADEAPRPHAGTLERLDAAFGSVGIRYGLVGDLFTLVDPPGPPDPPDVKIRHPNRGGTPSWSRRKPRRKPASGRGRPATSG